MEESTQEVEESTQERQRGVPGDSHGKSQHEGSSRFQVKRGSERIPKYLTAWNTVIWEGIDSLVGEFGKNHKYRNIENYASGKGGG